jgi:hypothetical protein
MFPFHVGTVHAEDFVETQNMSLRLTEMLTLKACFNCGSNAFVEV